jgi:hypothetical protein
MPSDPKAEITIRIQDQGPAAPRGDAAEGAASDLGVAGAVIRRASE